MRGTTGVAAVLAAVVLVVAGETVASGAGPGVCTGDTNADGFVDVLDLTAVIEAWDTGDPDADVNDDGTVDVLDLITVILMWGPCTVGCADPASNPPILSSIPVDIPGMLGITQDASGLLYVQGTGATQVFTFDTAGNAMGTIPEPAPIDPAGVYTGIAYDSLNNTLWHQDNSLNAQRLVETDLNGVQTGNVIPLVQTGANTTGVEYDPTTDTFFYLEILGDDVIQISRQGQVLNQIDQTCLDDGAGLFGNGLDIFEGQLELLVGPLDAGDAERIVPIAQIENPDTGTPDTVGLVTGLGAITDLGENQRRDFVRNRLNPNGSMFVTGRANQLIYEIDPEGL